MLVELTRMDGDPEPDPYKVCVNPVQVTSVIANSRHNVSEGGTVVNLTDGRYLYVRETLDEVVAKLQKGD